MRNKKILVTGSAGFIGFHLSKILLSKGNIVHGYDGLTDYYDVNLKRKRHDLLSKFKNFSYTEGMLEDEKKIIKVFDKFQPDYVVHLAAQAGVRYSLENPKAYISSNIIGTFNIIEACKREKIKHLLIASTSSVYGSNIDMPFNENQKADTQLTLYAATKKATENIGHSYAHVNNLPITMFRFFTVYGPWGRPDMALFKFTKSIFEKNKIDVYNNGKMYRDFTYIDDLAKGIFLLIKKIPGKELKPIKNDSLSKVAPFRIVNIGNSEKVRLIDFIEAIEDEIGMSAIKNYMPIQLGDVPKTWADVDLLYELTGFRPEVKYKEGIKKFVKWYKEFYLGS